MITTATSFYHYTNIKVNLTKSVIATINTQSNNSSIIFDHVTLQVIPKNQAFHFLGYWYTVKKKYKPTYKIIQQEIITALDKLRTARITEKQAIYIINTVILTRFNYQIQNTFFPKTNTQNITNQYTKIVKHKANLSSTFSNSTI